MAFLITPADLFFVLRMTICDTDTKPEQCAVVTLGRFKREEDCDKAGRAFMAAVREYGPEYDGPLIHFTMNRACRESRGFLS